MAARLANTGRVRAGADRLRPEVVAWGAARIRAMHSCIWLTLSSSRARGQRVRVRQRPSGCTEPSRTTLHSTRAFCSFCATNCIKMGRNKINIITRLQMNFWIMLGPVGWGERYLGTHAAAAEVNPNNGRRPQSRARLAHALFRCISPKHRFYPDDLCCKHNPNRRRPHSIAGSCESRQPWEEKSVFWCCFGI